MMIKNITYFFSPNASGINARAQRTKIIIYIDYSSSILTVHTVP